jgi:hypothetical protein
MLDDRWSPPAPTRLVPGVVGWTRRCRVASDAVVGHGAEPSVARVFDSFGCCRSNLLRSENACDGAGSEKRKKRHR